MNAQTVTQACLGCGRAFDCGMGNSEPCWCSAEFPAVMPLPESVRGCYCRECLVRLIAARRESRAI
ncbi:MAG TPA: cysteine-rich CWC family protein [Burkholderiales bacterium]